MAEWPAEVGKSGEEGPVNCDGPVNNIKLYDRMAKVGGMDRTLIPTLSDTDHHLHSSPTTPTHKNWVVFADRRSSIVQRACRRYPGPPQGIQKIGKALQKPRSKRSSEPEVQYPAPNAEDSNSNATKLFHVHRAHAEVAHLYTSMVV